MMAGCLYKLIRKVWATQNVLEDWKNASIVLLFIKYNRKECGNYERISLLSIVNKIIFHSLLNRLNVPEVIPNPQCAFRSGRRTLDMVFCLGQIQEKCTELNMPLHVVFLDFSKAFDTASRVGIW